MSGKKKIPCRVCGKLFEPCTYCQSHSDIFMWRNFACSIECAQKYINDTIAYRESLKKKGTQTGNTFERSQVTDVESIVKSLEHILKTKGLSGICDKGNVVSGLAMPRVQEIFACINRY